MRGWGSAPLTKSASGTVRAGQPVAELAAFGVDV